jgi:hypothetical protein
MLRDPVQEVGSAAVNRKVEATGDSSGKGGWRRGQPGPPSLIRPLAGQVGNDADQVAFRVFEPRSLASIRHLSATAVRRGVERHESFDLLAPLAQQVHHGDTTYR